MSVMLRFSAESDKPNWEKIVGALEPELRDLRTTGFVMKGKRFLVNFCSVNLVYFCSVAYYYNLVINYKPRIKKHLVSKSPATYRCLLEP